MNSIENRAVALEYQRKLAQFHKEYCSQWSEETFKSNLNKCSGLLAVLLNYIHAREDLDRMDPILRMEWFTQQEDDILMTGYPQDLATFHEKECIERRYAYLGYKLKR